MKPVILFFSIGTWLSRTAMEVSVENLVELAVHHHLGGVGVLLRSCIHHRFSSIPGFAEDAADDVDHQNDQYQDQRSSPGEFNLVIEGHSREVVDQYGERRCRAHQRDVAVVDQPVVGKQRGEQQGAVSPAARRRPA